MTHNDEVQAHSHGIRQGFKQATCGTIIQDTRCTRAE